MRVVARDRVVDVSAAELGEGVAFPRFVLPAVLGESQGWDASAEPAEESAGVDLGKLAGITDEHDLRVRGRGVVEDPGELAGADHARFVDDQHGAWSEVAVLVVVELDEQAGDGVAGDPGGGFELGRGAGRERGSR